MGWFGHDIERVRATRSRVTPPPDLGAFWSATLDAARALSGPVRVEPVRAGLALVECADITFTGHAGEPVRAWLHRPAGATGVLGCVVRYLGYDCGRGLPHQVPPTVLAGYAVLTMDNRGQGAGCGWVGATPDSGGLRAEPGGHLVRGIGDRDGYYYRRLVTDAVRAVDTARTLPGIDPDRVCVSGTSQGGGLALAVAGLVPGLAGVLANVPFLCEIPLGVQLATEPPYTEIAALLANDPGLAEAALRTVAHVDAAVLVRTATAPALFGVALRDRVCPPETVYAARHAYGGPARIVEYPFNDHEDGRHRQDADQLAWLLATVPPV